MCLTWLEVMSDEIGLFQPLPRVLRNLLGRFWGRTRVEEDSSEEEAERELEDDLGVD